MFCLGPAFLLKYRAMKTVLSFGEALWDLLPTGPVLGGAPCNLAYRVTCLGDRGLIATRLGRDDLGRRAFDRLASLGMDTGFVQWDDGRPTGTVDVRVGPDGSPDFTINPDTAYDRIEPTGELKALASRADALCFGTLAQRSEGNRRTLEGLLTACGGLKFLDINLRKDCFSPETIEASLRHADVLKLNESEADHLGGLFDLPRASGEALARALMRKGSLACCVVTLGGQGAAAFRGDERVIVPGAAVDVVDTCGSGDAFSAGFLHGYLRALPLAHCCRLGNALGALAATKAGATSPVSTAELQEFLNAPPPASDPPPPRFWLRRQ